MKKNAFLIVLCGILLNLISFGQNQTSGNYRNPIIARDIPDPSVIRVGNMYYAAGTTSDFAPIYPLYESTDLVNWKQIGSAFYEVPAWASRNFWAPELYFKDGTFYLYYTAKRKTDGISCIGVATTKDLRKGFTDQGIIVDWGKEAIDGFVFQDNDQKMYICWKAYGLNKERPIEILASELSADCLSLVGEHFSLTRYDEGWKGEGAEGECLIKHNGYYYLLYSVGGCCDNRCTYRVMVSRSKNLKTGWEQYSKPILQGNDTWKCPGHGTLATTPDERFFYLYHSYNATDFEYMGRQGMLDELVWDVTTGWPRFKDGDTPSVQTEMPFKNTSQKRDSVYSDDFSTDKNLKFWQWDLLKPKPEIRIENGLLILSSAQQGITFTGLSPQTGDYTFEAELSGETTDLSGICIYGNSENLLALAVNDSKLVLFQVKKGIREVLSENALSGEMPIFLKLEATHGRIYQFYWSNDQKNWNPVKIKNEYSVDGNFLPQWGVAMRTGLLIDNLHDSKAEFSSVQMKNKFNQKK